jgi:trehalose synthase
VIKHQPENGNNGFLVDSIKEAADKIVRIIGDKKLRMQIGRTPRGTQGGSFLCRGSW